MISMTLDEIAAVTGGRVVNDDGSRVVDGPVEYDSRKLVPGGLFAAFEGEKVDGHDFAAGAIAAGAAAVFSTRDTGEPGVVVTEPLAALAKLAHASVERLENLTIVGVTGSSGKTTTKDYIGQLLSRLGPTIALPGSLNNELGFPYTVLQATTETRYLVLEMGARAVGHIRFLCEIAPPRVGAVLNVGAAHIGKFGSLQGTAQAKGELVESLAASGVAVLNADDPLVAGMAPRTSAKVLMAGEAADADLRASDITLDGLGRAAYTLHFGEKTGHVSLAVTGRHQVANTLSAAGVALSLGLGFDETVAALGEVGIVSERRMDVFRRPDGVTVIDDSYNANTSSTNAALHAQAAMTGNGRMIAVLGYMAELGDEEISGHREVGRLAAELGAARIIAVDESAWPVLDGARSVEGWNGEASPAADQAEAIKILFGDLRAGDVVLVKASRYRTWDVADALRPEKETR